MGVARSQFFLDALLSARTRSSLPAIPQIPLEIAILDACEVRSVVTAPMEATAPIGQAPSAPTISQHFSSAPQPSVIPAKAGIHQSPVERVIPVIEVQAAPDVPIRYDFSPIQEADAPIADSTMPPSVDAPIFPLEELVNKWERCIAIVAEDNVALPLVLRGAVPIKVEGNTVTVSCTYAFHADALKEAKAKKILEDAIEKILSQRVNIVSVHIPAKNNMDAVSSFISGLGGAVA